MCRTALLPWADSNAVSASVRGGSISSPTCIPTLDVLAPGCRVVQVKEKFGGPRCYAHHPADLDEQGSAAFHARIQLAEAESRELCRGHP